MRDVSPLDETDPMLGACLLNIGDGDRRSQEDQETWGTGAISIAMISDTGYTVDVYPQKNSDLIRCGAAKRLPGSQLTSPDVYKSISTCLDARYKTDYENYIAKEAFQLEKMPDFSKLTGKAKTDWPQRAAEYQEALPFSCYIKKEEHFADAFGGQVYSAWAQKKDLTSAKFDTGLHFLTNIQCVEKVTKALAMSKHLYPSVADRLSLFLKPQAVADLKRCAPSTQPLCALAENAFSPSSSSGGRSGKSRSGKTAP